MVIACRVLVPAKSRRLDPAEEHFTCNATLWFEINPLTVESARRERYGWNPHISSIARTPYSLSKREDARDGPAWVADSPSTAPVWIYLFLIGDRPEQLGWAVVAGNDLAI